MSAAANKWALVTGASAGIGEEFARQLAQEGYSLVLVARRVQRLHSLKAELDHQVAVKIFAADLSQKNSVSSLFSFCAKESIEVDLVINNAGYGSCGRFADLDLNRELQMIDLNIRAVTEISHRFVQPMLERKRGCILVVASCGGFQPGPGMNTYFATKGYDLHFAEALDQELVGTGVSCKVLCPGPTSTEFFDVAGARTLKATPIPSMRVEDVVSYTLKKIKTKQRIIIPGMLNQMASFCYRFLPRKLITAGLGKILLHRI